MGRCSRISRCEADEMTTLELAELKVKTDAGLISAAVSILTTMPEYLSDELRDAAQAYLLVMFKESTQRP